jgi:hypothetical protein
MRIGGVDGRLLRRLSFSKPFGYMEAESPEQVLSAPPLSFSPSRDVGEENAAH